MGTRASEVWPTWEASRPGEAASAAAGCGTARLYLARGSEASFRFPPLRRRDGGRLSGALAGPERVCFGLTECSGVLAMRNLMRTPMRSYFNNKNMNLRDPS